jgi:hypothetical protein
MPGRAAHDYRERYLAKECVGSNRVRHERSQLPAATTTETNPAMSDTDNGLRLNRAPKSGKTGNHAGRYRCAKNSGGTASA